MKRTYLVVIGSILMAATFAQAQPATIMLKASIKATRYTAQSGKMVKTVQSNQSIISSTVSNAPAGSQIVAQFDTNTRQLTELDIVDPCGTILQQLATFTTDTNSVQDTGNVNGNQEIVSALTMDTTDGGVAYLVCDMKLTLDGTGSPQGGSAKCTGVMVDGDNQPSTISLMVTAQFKPKCP